MMKSYLTVVLTLTCLLGSGISAHAQDTEGVRVKVPFQFARRFPLAHTPLASSLLRQAKSYPSASTQKALCSCP